MNIPKHAITFLIAGCIAFSLVSLAGAAEKEGATGHAKKAVELSQQGAFDQAIQEFTLAIEASPKDVRLYRDRGGVYLTTRRFPEAVADFSKAIELAPKDYAGYSLRGAAQSELL